MNFGKDIDGKITMSVVNENQIILQLNSDNAYTINNALGDNADKLAKYVELLNFCLIIMTSIATNIVNKMVVNMSAEFSYLSISIYRTIHMFVRAIRGAVI